MKLSGRTLVGAGALYGSVINSADNAITGRDQLQLKVTCVDVGQQGFQRFNDESPGEVVKGFVENSEVYWQVLIKKLRVILKKYKKFDQFYLINFLAVC